MQLKCNEIYLAYVSVMLLLLTGATRRSH